MRKHHWMAASDMFEVYCGLCGHRGRTFGLALFPAPQVARLYCGRRRNILAAAAGASELPRVEVR